MKTAAIKFTKMHGLGNDFAVIDATNQSIEISQIPIQKLSNRYTGIGFDQLIWIMPSKQADIACRFFNSDGNEAEQCGNGVRCVARFVYENGLCNKKNLRIETKAGIVDAIIHDYSAIEAKLGLPHYSGKKILTLGKEYELMLVSMGNPHAIILVESLSSFPVAELGQQISTHPDFPQGINVGFMQIIQPEHILLRTYERGAGITYACGSNACAAVVAGVTNNLLAKKVTVELALGHLQVEWQGEGSSVIMTGPGEKVFEGEI